mgnify:CR=1 FL=1
MNTPVQGSPVQGQCRNTGGTIVRVLQGTASKLRRAARLAMDNPTRRSLLKMLVTHNNGVTYQQLFEALPVSERWVREIVADLRREGVVETPGNPALIQFTSHDVMVAVKEVLAFLASDWVDTITGEKDVQTALSSSSSSAPAFDTEKYLKTIAGILRGTGG